MLIELLVIEAREGFFELLSELDKEKPRRP
jgi:hypothetical protein